MDTRRLYTSTNPFNESFDENIEDGGDDSSCYEDCMSESTSLLSPNIVTESYTVAKSVPTVSHTDIAPDNHDNKIKGKRTAPLNFDQVHIQAKPALKFDQAENDNTFLSPLESILMSPSIIDDNEDDEHDSENDDTDLPAQPQPSLSQPTDVNDSYFSMSYWSNIVQTNIVQSSIVQSPTQFIGNSKRMFFSSEEQSQLALSNSIHPMPSESYHSTHSDEYEANRITQSPLMEGSVSSRNNSTNSSDKKVDLSIQSPLTEASNVLSRMDSVFSSLTNHSNINSTSKRQKKRKVSSKMPTVGRASKILHQIDTGVKDTDLTMDHRHIGKPWSRMILLEELGTASSWVVLLLPYIAFMIALVLDSDSTMWDSVTRLPPSHLKCPMVASYGSMSNASDTFPLMYVQNPCFYKYEPSKDIGVISMVERNVDLYDEGYVDILSGGVVFSSGPIIGVPVISTFLSGDVEFDGLSNEIISLVRLRSIYYSTVVLQQDPKDSSSDGKWFPVSVSKPDRLALVCDHGTNLNLDGSLLLEDTTWTCRSPRIVDILFSLPDTSFYRGGPLRIDTILSYHDISDDHNCKKYRKAFGMMGERENCTSTTPTASSSDMLKTATINSTDLSPDSLISDFTMSARYTISHRRPLYSDVAISVRMISLIISICFFSFWFWSMGLDGFFGIGRGACCNWTSCLSLLLPWYEQYEASKRGQEIAWWESPWFLFPERRYLFFLLLALILIQNPLLAVMYFRPNLYGSAFLRFLVDTLIGVGIHTVLCLWLCLFQGLRYHTSKIALKRAEHQKQALELQKAAKYLVSAGNPDYKYHENASDCARSYYEEYGDLEGRGFEINNLRMKHDPCGDSFLDFILPKVALLLIGFLSVICTACSRYPGSFSTDGMLHDSLDRDSLQFYRSIYVAGSLIQIVVLASWIILIVKSGLYTGRKLKREKFLSTRPAQLAFRVLASIMLGGIGSAVIPSLFNFLSLINKWTSHYQGSQFDHQEEGQSSIFLFTTSSGSRQGRLITFVNVLFKIIEQCTKKVPYSGTAAGLGPGKIIYITVCTLIVAFIFLPSRNLHDETDTHDDVTYENQRRDKRMVVTLAKYTHTWRIFPLPIQKVRFGVTQIRQGGCFQINRKFHHHQSPFGRGAIYKSNYIPVFCIEIALWLLECSWQAYYSATEYKTDDWAPGKMNLQSLGLNLEADIIDEKDEIHAFVASNLGAQIDGEEDSIIVVGFRGTASTSNVLTDLKFTQVPLPEIFQRGLYDNPEFQVNVQTSFDIENHHEPCVSVINSNRWNSDYSNSISTGILKKTPLARQALPLIHQGFLEAYLPVRDELMESVVKVVQRQLSKSILRQAKSCSSDNNQSPLVLPKIYITGHSMGGALGQLLALDIANNIEITCLQQKESLFNIDPGYPTLKYSTSVDASNDENHMMPVLKRRNSFPPKRDDIVDSNFEHRTSVFQSFLDDFGLTGSNEAPKRIQPAIAVYSFGQPRVGNHAFARLYKKFVPHTFRVAHECDAITSLPFAATCGVFILYKHAGLEVMLDEGSTGNTLVGPTVVETLFRFSKVRTKMTAHLIENYRSGIGESISITNDLTLYFFQQNCVVSSLLEGALTQDELQEFYQYRGGERVVSKGYNPLPDWVTQKARS